MVLLELSFSLQSWKYLLKIIRTFVSILSVVEIFLCCVAIAKSSPYPNLIDCVSRIPAM